MTLMVDKKDPPIEPQEFLAGVRVVDIGDLRVARGFSRRPPSVCKHSHLHYDHAERRIWCPDCEQNIDPFDAFEQLVTVWAEATDKLNRRREDVDAAEKHALISIAAKTVDEIWRRRRMVPVCPVCASGLFPEDFRRRGVTLGRPFAAAFRAKKGKPVPGYVMRDEG
jgi:hypothetical protein